MPAHSFLPLSYFFGAVWTFVFARFRTVLVACLVFSLLGGVLSTIPERGIDRREDQLSSALGITWQKLREDVQQDLQILSTLSTEELIVKMESLPLFADASASEHIGLVYAVNVIPYVLVIIGIFLLLALVAGTYFLLLFSAPNQTAYGAASRLPLAVIEMLVLWFWVSIRSLVWLPLVGPFVALYTLPRLSLSPALLLSEKRGALAAAKESWKRTKKQWIPAALRLFLLLLFCIPLLWILAVPVSVASLFSLKLASLLWMAVLIFLTAYLAAGLTVLTR